jgi:elongation factor G
MKAYPSDLIRNVTLAGHQGAGKTLLVEAMLYHSGATTRLGRIEDGSTVSDFDDDERERQISISASLIPLEHGGCKINLLDTPGFTDFQGEVQQAVRVTDAVVIVVDAVAGPEVGTEMAMQFAVDFNQPVLIVINKMDRDNANFNQTLEALRKRFPDHKFIPVILPLGEQANFKGVLNTVTQKAYMGKGETGSDVPAEYKDAIEAAHLAVVEAAAEADDTYIEKYFETGELTIDEIRDGMRKAAKNADLLTVPVFVTSASSGVGIIPLLEALTVYVQPAAQRRVSTKADLADEEIEFLNPPQSDSGPLVAYVFKSFTDKYGTLTYFRIFSGSVKSNEVVWNPNTEQEERLGQLMTVRGREQTQLDALHAGDIGVVAKLKNTYTGNTLTTKAFGRFVPGPKFPEPVYSVAVHPKTQTDSAKIAPVLTSLTQADQTLRWRQDPATKQAVLSGMGSVQVEIAIKRAERLGCNMETSVPKVPYQETITRKASSVYRHKKQTGGAGQFAEVHLRLEPIDPSEGVEFKSEIVGGSISGPFIQSTEKGVRQVVPDGVIAGYPVVGVRAVVYDGKEHPVDSKDIAFQLAGRGAFKNAFQDAGPVILEPYVNVRISVPEENTGDIMGDMTSRRGRVQGMDTVAGRTIITAQVPQSEILRYSNDLRSMTGGRGVFIMEFSHYEQMPSHLAAEVIAAHKAAEEEE